MSTDAILYFGIPINLDDAPEDLEMDDFAQSLEDGYLKKIGFEFHKEDEDWKVYNERKKVAMLGLEFDYHSSSDDPMYFIYSKMHRTYRGDDNMISPEMLNPHGDDAAFNMKTVLEKLGFPFIQPAWHLVVYMDY